MTGADDRINDQIRVQPIGVFNQAATLLSVCVIGAVGIAVRPRRAGRRQHRNVQTGIHQAAGRDIAVTPIVATPGQNQHPLSGRPMPPDMAGDRLTGLKHQRPGLALGRLGPTLFSGLDGCNA